MSGLFNRDVGVEVGDTYVDIAIEASGIPHPMKKVRVEEIDETGMVHLRSSIFADGERKVVSPATLAQKFRRE